MKLHRIMLACLALVISYSELQAQTQQDQVKKLMPNPLPTSPNVASIDKFGEYSVSHFHGLPDISIPIFEVKSGELSIPISLSYHASGIKYNETAGWVGLGWALSAGGQISRTVRGTRDEIGYYSSTSGALKDGASTCNDYNYLWNIALGNDAEPDIFSYSFPGKDGRFLLGKQGATLPYLVPFEPISIKAPAPMPVTTFDKFEITDEHGTLYRFGTSSSGNKAIEGTGSTVNGVTVSGTSAWLLMDMEAPNSDDKISIDYNDFVGKATTYDVSSTVQITDLCSGTSGSPCADYMPHQTNSTIQSETDQLFVSTIKYKFGKVEFLLGDSREDQTGLKNLERINIYGLIKGQYVLIKSVKFIYSYFVYRQTQKLALKLDTVQFLDNQNKLVNKYAFGYSSNNFYWDNIYARDYWGFYNGMPNTDLIPVTPVIITPGGSNTSNLNWSIGSADRTPVPFYYNQGMLNKITFPTGGFTKFEYESHQYLDLNNRIVVGGGLRIQRITSDANDGSAPVIKEYKYGKTEKGYGDPNFNPLQYIFKSQFDFEDKACLGDGGPVYDNKYRIRTWSSRAAFETDGFETAPVNYTYVTEYFKDSKGNTLSKNVYEYDNGNSSSSGTVLMEPRSSKMWVDSYSWRHGFLTHKSTYDNKNYLVSEKKTEYGYYKAQDKFVGYSVCVDASVVGCPQNGCYDENHNLVSSNVLGVIYLTQSSGAVREISSKEYLYNTDAISDTSRHVLTQIDNTYEQTNILVDTTVISRSSNVDQLVTVKHYPFNLSSDFSSKPNALGIRMLNEKHIVSLPIETITYRQNSDRSNARIISGQVTTFAKSELNSNYVVPDAVFLLESNISIPKLSYVFMTATSDGVTMDTHYKRRISFTNYDAFGNLTQVQKVNDLSMGYIWGYNNSLLIAEVVNALVKNVFYTSFEDETIDILQEGKTGDQSSSAGLNKTLTGLDPGNYILSYYKKEETLWSLNVSTVTVPASGNYTINISGQVDEVRFYPEGARLKTFTHNSLLGITSSTDSNGLTTYYSYDSFGRLASLKDDGKNLQNVYKYNYDNYRYILR